MMTIMAYEMVRRKMSVKRLAELTGLSQKTVYEMAGGEEKATAAERLAVAKALGVAPGILFKELAQR